MTLREAFQAVYDTHGELTAELVVATARDGKDAVAERLRQSLPDDPEDALYRLQLIKAQELIRKVKIIYKKTPRSSLRETRAFVSISSPSGRAYHPADVVAHDPFMSRLALQDAEREWRNLKRRYENLEGFVEMILADLKVAA